MLYGGSVNAHNCAELIDRPHIDGLFIGRAGWQAEGYIDKLTFGIPSFQPVRPVLAANSAEKAAGGIDPLGGPCRLARTKAIGAPMTILSTPQADEIIASLDSREALCREIALSAGAIALQGFGNLGSRVSMKGPQDFLTETDAAVERHIRSAIAAAFPEDGFLGEETGGILTSRIWVVDPIDGTANFARGIPHFCISIAFVADGEIELGAIYNPGFDELYTARRGFGAFRNGEPIRVAATTDYTTACVEFGWSNRLPNSAYIDVLAKIFQQGANIRRGASGALGLAYVADGRSDAYAELHMQPWDCLAGLLLVREAGGVTCSFLREGGLADGGPVLAAAPGIAAGMSEATGILLKGDPPMLNAGRATG